MKNILISQHVIGFLVRSPRRFLPYEQPDSKQLHTSQLSYGSSLTKQTKLGPKIAEILNGKLRLGAKILQVGRSTKVFKRNFSVREGEKLVKAFQCFLSTTAGPIAGLLFISTNKVAFCSEKTIKISSTDGEAVNIHYKVLIPLTSINKARQVKDINTTSKKYIEIVTMDNFDFWFMGFVNQHKTFEYLQQSISKAQS